MSVQSVSTSAPTKREVIRWAEPVARCGYAAKGFVFGTVGVLAVMAATGTVGGDVTGAKGAIDYLAGLGGGVVFGLIALGMAAFAAWRFVQAFLDPEGKGSDAAGIARRAGLAVSGLTYGSLAVFAGSQVFSSVGGSSSGGDGAPQQAAEVMSVPGGVWLVGIFGVIMIGVGLYQGYRAFVASFREHWRKAQMSSVELTWATRISRVGVAARAIAFIIIGWSFLQAGLTSKPSEARGLEGALQTIGDGSWLLGAIGAGFVCYGIYCVVNARYKSLKD